VSRFFPFCQTGSLGNTPEVKSKGRKDAMKKQNMKRILNVTIRRMLDDSPDTSWLGEYSNRPTSEFSIDRKHSLDCPVNNGKEGLLWYTSGSGRIELQLTWEQAKSVSHSGECDSDVLELSKVPEIKTQLEKIDPAILSAELKEFGAWDETKRADHSQNLQRILWIAGGDITDNPGCNCSESGDMQRNEYQYFNPSFNYVDKSGHALPENSAEEVRKYVRQDYERMESLNRGDFYFLGIRAEATLGIPNGDGIGNYTIQRITSGGLWEIESDSEDSYFEEIEQDELAELQDQLKALGFSSRAISTAFKNVEHKEQ
jgi:hypothetical protein